MYPILRLSNDWDTFHFGMKLEVTTNKHQSPIIIPVPTKALIFTKFETYAHKIRFDYQIFFRKDPCMHMCVRAVNTGASDKTSLRKKIWQSILIL